MKRYLDIPVAVFFCLTFTIACMPDHPVVSSGLVTDLSVGRGLPDSSLLQEGDVVLRRGKGIISRLFQRMSMTDRSFSHAGILLFRNERWMVLHIIGREGADAPDLLLEPMERYCAADISDSNAVFRLTSSKELRDKVVQECIRINTEAPEFDDRFDLSTDSSLYCTELVYKVYRNATSGVISLPLTRFAGIQYTACDNLYYNPFARQIYPPPSHDYKSDIQVSSATRASGRRSAVVHRYGLR